MEPYDLFHVSLEPVHHFAPRIPSNRGKGEDAIVPRVCTSTEIVHCISAMPYSGFPLYAMQELFHLKPTLYVYRFERSQLDFSGLGRNGCARVVGWDELQRLGKVPDAAITKEHWLLDTPLCVEQVIYEVTRGCFETAEYNEDILFAKSVDLTVNPDAKDNRSKLLAYFPVQKQEDILAFILKYGLGQILYECGKVFQDNKLEIEAKK